MKFIFADSLDFIDPGYDFARDVNAPGRRPYWDDVYPHEFMSRPPYDGMLVSRAIVGDHSHKGKYTESQSMRFKRVGARKFLRLDEPRFQSMPIYGDCGAFSYANEAVPPFRVDEMVRFYDEGEFDYGCSIDHIIFDFVIGAPSSTAPTQSAQERFDITLENADEFRKVIVSQGLRVVPIGVVQGWSPESMAEAARRLVAMGYDYVALGGMAPLKSPAIHAALDAVRSCIPSSVKVHVLGFSKIDDIADFSRHRIDSIDSTSPLIRAFKDAKNNYYAAQPDGSVKYYMAVRIPQAIENPRLQRLVKQGELSAEELTALEQRALSTLREFDRDERDLESTLSALLEYASFIEGGRIRRSQAIRLPLTELARSYRRILEDRPWKACPCEVCRESGVEVAIFRASNRNKRRGIHNLFVAKGIFDRLNRAELTHANA